MARGAGEAGVSGRRAERADVVVVGTRGFLDVLAALAEA
jgi:hypothetical protein